MMEEKTSLSEDLSSDAVADHDDDDDDDDESLELHLSDLKAKHVTLTQEKAKMEEDFCIQRAKLKELYLQKEAELRMRTEENLAYAVEVEDLKNQLHQIQTDLEEARSQVTIAQCTAENEVAVEKRKYEEELASVQQILREEIASAEDEIKQLRNYAKKVEQQKLYYKALHEKYIEDSDLKKESLLSPGVLSAVTKSIAKRVPSLSPAHSPHLGPSSAERTPIIPPGGTSIAAPTGSSTTTPSGGVTTPIGEQQPENLEDSMKRAQEDAEVLRSLVVPLEEEINALKDKIREQDAQLRMYESQEQIGIKTADVLAPLFQGKSPEELVQELDEKLQGMKTTLEVEKASRADLELYTAILNTQKTALADTVDRLREQTTELRQLYEDERKEHMELKDTWQRANDQFLEAQRLHLSDMRRIRSLLTAEQLRKLHDLQRVDSKEEETAVQPKLTTENVGKEGTAELSSHSPCFEKINYNDLSRSQEELEKLSSDDTVSTLLDSYEGMDSLDEDSNKVGGNVLGSKYSPEKMPQLTDDQKKALSEISGDESRQAETLLTDSDPVVGISSPVNVSSSQRVVSEAEWRRLQEEIKKSRSRMADTCPLCLGLESQLKKVQTDLRESEKERTKVENANARQKEDLERESLYRKQTEAQWTQKAEEYDKKVKDLQALVDRVTGKHSQVVCWSKKTVHILEGKLRSLTENREVVHTELKRLQGENDNLVGKHSQHSQELQNEIINLPDSMEDMHLLLLRYREDVIAAKVAKEQIEETSNSNILFLKDQILKEQHEKSSMEDMLNADIDQLRKKVLALEKKESQLEAELKLRIEMEDKLREVEQKSQDSSLKSQQLISALKGQVDEQSQARTRYEATISELKGRVASLQHDLEMSEAVQRDFVRLSQSLQVQLEKIRQSEKEVRWQHEEDIEECNNCKQRFTAVGRRKNHCRHCGKIFCADCLAKTVASGPNGRPSKVCDVCHTLLVQDATPFFSREPPQSPD